MNIDITGLTRRFGRNEAVAGVNLEAGPGVFGLLGLNGAGKTSLLRMMATVIPPLPAGCGCSGATRVLLASAPPADGFPALGPAPLSP